MNETRDFDEGSFGHPRTQVYAIIQDAESALRAARELNYLGIKSPDIRLLMGREDATKLEAEDALSAKVAGIGLGIGNRDSDHLTDYRGALLEDYAVIAVVTHDCDSREKVRALLKTYGAYAMNNFGQLRTGV
jgi:hypothetical protein